MKKAVIEVESTEQELIDKLNACSPDDFEIVKSSRFSGTVETLTIWLPLIIESIKLLSEYIAFRKVVGNKSITVDGKKIILENLSKEEIEAVLEKELNGQ